MTKTVIDDNYEVREDIGTGSVATAFAVVDRITKAKLALKCLRPLKDETPAAKAALDRHKERFSREVEAMIKLDHPGIVRIYDCNLRVDNPYYVMEFCGGGSLNKLIETGPITKTVALDTLWPICAALHYAHSKGVIHRDIKPANILFTSAGQAKLGDFGMCRIADWHTLTCGDDSMLGTLYYLSPEQAQDPQSADARSDIFSLGRTIRHMLVGSPMGTSLPSHTASSARDRRRLEPWDRIVAQMTALSRNRRPKSIRAVARLLHPLSKTARIGRSAKWYRETVLRVTEDHSPEPLRLSPDDFTRLLAMSVFSRYRGPEPFFHREDLVWLKTLARHLSLRVSSMPLAYIILALLPSLWGRKRPSRRFPSTLLLDAQKQALMILGPDGARSVRDFARFLTR
jgi:serine/threonine protein kinase